MQHHNTPFDTLIDAAASGLNKPYEKLKSEYLNLPICLMQYLEDGIWTYAIEVRFDTCHVTLMFIFDERGDCKTVHLFFDNGDNENTFIDYLNTLWTYDYHKYEWQLTNSFVKLKDGDGFYFFSFSSKLDDSVLV